jgi:hypothetical protein
VRPVAIETRSFSSGIINMVRKIKEALSTKEEPVSDFRQPTQSPNDDSVDAVEN